VPGLADGAHVHQGQVIAYVGMTGPRDRTAPCTTNSASDGDHSRPAESHAAEGQTARGGELAEFRRRSAPLMAELALLDPPAPRVASR
jgi:hypothetical protein